MPDNPDRIMNKRRLLNLIILFGLMVLVFVGCDENGKKQDAEQNVTPTKKVIIFPTQDDTAPDVTSGEVIVSETVNPTDEPTVAPTAEPTAEPTEEPYEDKFIDVVARKNFYLLPGETKTIELSEKWFACESDAISCEQNGAEFTVTAKSTGYLKFATNDGDIAYVYCNKEVEKNEDRKVKDGFPYYLYFEKGSHTLTVYEGEDGYYTKPLMTITTASGSTPDKTPVGTFTLSTKERWHAFNEPYYAQYAITYKAGRYLHSPCFDGKNENQIFTYYYDSIGENSTGGCLRMQTGYIYWIYNNCDSGTSLEIVNGSPRGTSSERPTEIPESACYDPTDPILKDR